MVSHKVALLPMLDVTRPPPPPRQKDVFPRTDHFGTSGPAAVFVKEIARKQEERKIFVNSPALDSVFKPWVTPFAGSGGILRVSLKLVMLMDVGSPPEHLVHRVGSGVGATTCDERKWLILRTVCHDCLSSRNTR